MPVGPAEIIVLTSESRGPAVDRMRLARDVSGRRLATRPTAPSLCAPTEMHGGQSGLYVNSGQAIVKGGQATEHTSFRRNNFGIYLWGGTVDVEGTEIDPGTPDVSDVDVDVNGIGLNSMVNDSTPSSVVRGLHVQGNSAYGLLCGSPLVLRGSYIANNAMVGVIVEGNGLDLGNPVGPDHGRNIFVGNVGGDICGGSAQQPVLAAGNIFGTIDCAVGGKLDPSVTCGDTTSINVANCTF